MNKVIAPIVVLLMSIGLFLFMVLPSSPDLEIVEVKTESPSSEIGVFHPFSREDIPSSGLKFNLVGYSEDEVEELHLIFDVILQVDKELIQKLSNFPIKAENFSNSTRLAGTADTVNDIMSISVEMIPDQISCMASVVHETYHLLKHEEEKLQSKHCDCEYQAWDYELQFLEKLKEMFKTKIDKDSLVNLEFNISDCKFKRKHYEFSAKVLTFIESQMDEWLKEVESLSNGEASDKQPLLQLKSALLFIHQQGLLTNTMDDKTVPGVAVDLRSPGLGVPTTDQEKIQLLFEEWQQTRQALVEAGQQRQKLIQR